MLHRGQLYSWTQGQDQIKTVQNTLEQRLIRVNEDLIVREDKDDGVFQKMKLQLVNVELNSYTKEELHVEKLISAKEEIQGFGYDQRQRILILLYSSTDGKDKTRIKIQDIRHGKQLWW